MRGCDVSTRPTTEEPPESHRAGHIAGDLFVSTRDALAALYPLLSWGGLVYIDDYGSFEGCKRAVNKYRATHKIYDRIWPIFETGKYHASTAVHEAVWWRKGG